VRTISSARLVTAVAAAGLLLGACGDGGSTDRGVTPTTQSYTVEGRVLVPGAPGESAEVVEPGGTVEILGTGYTEAEIVFMEQMIPHHSQALAMAELAAERASDEQVKALADRIRAAQGPEIETMEIWLEERELPVPSESERNDHGAHQDMPGMASPLEMQLLEEATGGEFDRMFLEYMIAHHEGALQMAEPVVDLAYDPIAGELARDVSVGQTVEIGLMREMLDRMG
jgi:uncharacterized protein (DUF305 family)